MEKPSDHNSERSPGELSIASSTWLPQSVNNISFNIQTNPPIDTERLAMELKMPLTAQQFQNYNSASVDLAAKQETNVIINQPMRESPKPLRPWRSGLYSICDDVKVCFCTLFCLHCYASCVASDMGESCCLPVCVPSWLVAMRTKIRTQENIEGSIMRDCCVSFWCTSCALCQLAREVKHIRNKA